MSDYNDRYDPKLGKIIGDGKCQSCGRTITVYRRGAFSDYTDGEEVEPKHVCDPDDVRRHTGY